ncbi:uncharacterized protein LOC129361694 [Poeciliopsis prolifica]|uniref:uncharacterized protein LOC129361694 n=1 Tax=Poeciliopsis prolifica TaxID=188132 RepID=UPI0024133137|nr:uncharacterized protein LOC129361694 [Poeciliopsis prolifica]
MASSKPARLKVILGESNTEKLTLPNGIPDSLDDLLSKVKDTFGLKTNIRLQYMDKDFGNDFFNLSSTSDLEDLGTVKASGGVNEEPGIEDFKDRWPALFQQKEINAEFLRLMALPLEQTFFAQLDRLSSQLIKVIKAKGGATRAKIAGIMRIYDEVEDIGIRRECVLKGLITFLGEDPEDLIKEYSGSCGDDAQWISNNSPLAMFVIRKKGEGLEEIPRRHWHCH